MKKTLTVIIIGLLCFSMFSVLTPKAAASSAPPVGYWKFDEGSGATAYDSSGNGNTGTLVNNPQWIDGVTGKALEFNGNSYVSIPDSPSLDISGNQISAEFWVKFDNAIVSSTPYMKFYDKGNAYNSAVGGGGIRFTFWITGDSSANLDSNTKSFLAGKWYHIAQVYDGSTMYIYINGVLDNSMAMTGNIASTFYPVAIGAYTLGGQWFLQGAIDEFKIYNNARTAEEIQADYISLAQGPVGYWKFDEGSGNIAYDSSGNGNNGIIHTATWTAGIIGNALHFNGIDSWVEVPNSPTLTGVSQITLEAWIQEDSITVDLKGIISKCDGFAPPTNAEYFLGTNDYGRVFFEADNGVAIFGSNPSTHFITETGKWYHVAGTWSGDSYAVYVNGVKVDSGTCTPQTTRSNTLPVQIGRHGTWSWVYFQGIIDEVKIYNYARTAEDIQSDYTSVAKPDFEISAAPKVFGTADPHSPTEYLVTVQSLNGFNQPVTLSAVFDSHELSGIFLDNAITPPANNIATTTLIVSVLSEEIITHQIYITGTSGSLSHTKAVSLNVPFMSIPYLSQGDTQWCVPSSVAMVMRFYGINVHQWDVAAALGKTHDDSFFAPLDMSKLQNYLTRNGLGSDVSWWVTKESLTTMLSNGEPVVLGMPGYITPLPGDHAVILTGWDANVDNFFVNDPGGALIEAIFGNKINKPYAQISVPWTQLSSYCVSTTYAIGISGNPAHSTGVLNLIGSADATNSFSFSHGEYAGINNVYIWDQGKAESGTTEGLTWKIKDHGTWIDPADYLLLYTGNEWVVNPTDSMSSYTFEVDFVKEGYAKPLILDVPSVKACSWGNPSYTTTNIYQILGDNYGEYTISVKLMTKSNVLLDQISLPAIHYKQKASKTTVKSPANLFLTDPQGHSIGVDPSTGKVVNDIPDAFYSGIGTEPQVVMIPDPIDGTYSIELIGTATGAYTLDFEYVNGTQTVAQSFGGAISAQQTKYYSEVISSAGQITPISWEYVFKDPKRGTMLKISTDDKYFQFTAPSKDFGIKQDSKMIVLKNAIAICYNDSSMSMAAVAIIGKINSCASVAYDKLTKKTYTLIA